MVAEGKTRLFLSVDSKVEKRFRKKFVSKKGEYSQILEDFMRKKLKLNGNCLNPNNHGKSGISGKKKAMD